MKVKVYPFPVLTLDLADMDKDKLKGKLEDNNVEVVSNFEFYLLSFVIRDSKKQHQKLI